MKTENWIRRKFSLWSQRSNTECKELVLHVADLGSVCSTVIMFPAHHQDVSQSSPLSTTKCDTKKERKEIK